MKMKLDGQKVPTFKVKIGSNVYYYPLCKFLNLSNVCLECVLVDQRMTRNLSKFCSWNSPFSQQPDITLVCG